MIVTTEFDYVVGRWGFKIRDRSNEAIEYNSMRVYLREEDADAAGYDAIEFSAHRTKMEGKL